MHDEYAATVLAAFETRFWSKVEKGAGPDACWVWVGLRNPRQYGMFKGIRGKLESTHRVAYAMRHGSVPPDMLVCHRCDNPPCVNPSHLFLGTVKDNSDDKYAKGRANNVRGETHHKATVTEATVVEVRRLADSKMRRQDIADRFSVSLATVNFIAQRKTWKHVPEATVP